MKLKPKTKQSLEMARMMFTAFGGNPKVKEICSENTYEYQFDGETFATMELDGDTFHIEHRIPEAKKAWYKDFKSKRVEFLPLKGKKGWYRVTLSNDGGVWTESEVGINVGLVIKELSAK